MALQDDPSFGFDELGLQKALGELARHFALAVDDPVPAPGGQEGLKALTETLPDRGLGEIGALELLAPLALDGAARLRHPGFLAHMDPPTPWISWAGWLWAAALNQNLLHPDVAPAGRPLEERVVAWLAPFFGMNGGHLVPGSSVATLTALWAAREVRGVEEVVSSAASHLSVRKAASILGLRYREIPVDADQRLRPEELGDLSRAALVLTAGTVAAGAIDPLDAGSDAAWRHVDAAWAGPLRLSLRHRSLLTGVERADSVAVSGHKWLFQPKECGLVLFSDTQTAHQALSFGGGYLSAPNIGILGSHAQSALPLAATLLAWGRHGLATRLEQCMAIAAELAVLVGNHDELELFATPVAGVVLWRPRHAEPQAVREHLTGAFVSLAIVGGKPWLRSVSANPFAEPDQVVDRVLTAARAVAQRR